MFRCLTFALMTVCLSCGSAAAQQIHYMQNIVFVYGTSNADVVTVDIDHRWGPDKLRVRMDYLEWDADDNEWDDEDETETFDFDEVDFIVFYGGDGADVFDVEDVEEMVEEGITFDCYLYGQGDSDTLRGGPGADFIDGGQDGVSDVLAGGPGGDWFVRRYRVVPLSMLWRPGSQLLLPSPLRLPGNQITLTRRSYIEPDTIEDFVSGTDRYHDLEVN